MRMVAKSPITGEILKTKALRPADLIKLPDGFILVRFKVANNFANKVAMIYGMHPQIVVE